METLWQDVVYALRVLSKRPGFTLVASLTLALGIAANTAIFSLIDGVLLRALPFPAPGRLVSLWTIYPESRGQQDVFSPPNYLDVAARSQTLEAVGGSDDNSFALATAGQPESIPGERMTASMGRVLGITPQLGRWFTQEEDDGGQAVAVISDSLWRSRLGADRNILGRTLIMNGRSFVVVGVMPPQTGFPSTLTQVYVPINFTPDDRQRRNSVYLNVIARMRPGVAPATVEAELRTIAPTLGPGLEMGLVPLQASMVGNVRPLLVVLWAAVGFMLAVGCANVANLLLAHAAGRQREFALRRSLGATNGRIVRQLLTESLTLAGFGGVVGLAVAAWAVPVMAAQLPPTFPHIRDMAVNARVLWFTFGLSMLTGVLFGLAPAIGSSRSDLSRNIRREVRQRAGKWLVAGEIAAVVVLVIGAGLVLRSLVRLSAVDPGFRPHGLIAWQMFLPPARYDKPAVLRTFHRTVLEQVAALPGVEGAALVQPPPFGPVDLVTDSTFLIAGRPEPTADQHPQGLVARASASYFAVMGIPVKRGRAFTEQDGETSQSVIISESLARRYFAGQDPVGQQLLLGRGRLAMQIVGVVGDVKHLNLRADLRPEFYLPMPRFPTQGAALIVRTSMDPAALLPSLQRRVWSVDGSIPANLASPIERTLYASMAPARIATLLLGVFAAITLVLGLVGVYGVLSYQVRQRSREIGIRLALGATGRDVLGMVLGEALGLAACGVAVGSLAALALTRFLESLLYGVKAMDPATFAVAVVAVPLAAMAAAWLPARRAMLLDPSSIIRE